MPRHRAFCPSFRVDITAWSTSVHTECTVRYPYQYEVKLYRYNQSVGIKIGNIRRSRPSKHTVGCRYLPGTSSNTKMQIKNTYVADTNFLHWPAFCPSPRKPFPLQSTSQLVLPEEAVLSCNRLLLEAATVPEAHSLHAHTRLRVTCHWTNPFFTLQSVPVHRFMRYCFIKLAQ